MGTKQQLPQPKPWQCSKPKSKPQPLRDLKAKAGPSKKLEAKAEATAYNKGYTSYYQGIETVHAACHELLL